MAFDLARGPAMVVGLAEMGADIRERPDWLEITGGKLHGADVHGREDYSPAPSLASRANESRSQAFWPGDGR